jgi:uracil-DNA glycosylase family 4
MKCGKIDLGCTKCRLCRGRTQVVAGSGPCLSRIVFVGEAPGKDEDLQGQPFVGRAGKILESVLADLGVDRSRVYITNTVKCRPPGNRRPRADEIRICRKYLDSELDQISPSVICALGQIAANSLLGNKLGMKQLMRKDWAIHVGRADVKVTVAYHPAACLYGKKNLGPFMAQIKKSLIEADVI